MHLLALEWDQFEARLVVAQRRAGELRIEHAFSVSLAPRDPGQTFADVDVGQRLESAMSARHIGRAETIVAVGRSNIELRRLTLPPAPEDELPELVRFQAVPQFSNLGEDWPLDFFPIGSATGEGQNVLAATISPQLVRQISETCTAAGLRPLRLVLRPCAAASLLIQHGGPARHRIRLFADLLADEADLTVLVEEDVVLMRTVRLPAAGHSAEEQAKSLVAEIRRTMAAAQNQLGGERVEQVVLCGSREDHRPLAEAIAEKLSLPVEHFDPFARVPCSRELTSHPPERPERFAPLLGLVMDEAQGRRHAIDFLNPRKKPPPPNRRRVFAIAGVAAAVIFLAIFAAGSMELAGLDRRQRSLLSEVEGMQGDVKRAEVVRERAARLGQWSRGNVNWLDELEQLSTADHFPPAEDARLARWNVVAREGEGGRMVLEGHARDSTVIRQAEGLLRGSNHTVKSGLSVQDPQDPRYPWRFSETVEIDPLEAAAAVGRGGEGGAQ